MVTLLVCLDFLIDPSQLKMSRDCFVFLGILKQFKRSFMAFVAGAVIF
jgi:hypothetical protein